MQRIVAPEEIEAFRERLLRLLEHRTALYTMGDSTSVPTHVALDLLRSVCFVLGIDPDSPELPPRLLSVDLEDEFRQRLAEIQRKVELAARLWREAAATLPSIPSTALHDTMASIGDFPSAYDVRSMAHEITCSIDYPLCHPVPESLAGVDYIVEYLRRLLIENDFLRRFDTDACERVLASASPDHVDLLVNLYEPVATNAIGRAAIGADPRALRLSDENRAAISRVLEPLGVAARERALREAALAVGDALAIDDENARRYLADLASTLLPRIGVGLARGNLKGVFV